MSAPPSLDVVIVAYRSRGLLRACLESLLANPPDREMSVHVVDNASGDGTVEMLRERFGEVRLLANDRNLGFSAANNAAIRSSAGDYVLALNPDTRLGPGALERLCVVLDADPSVGMCGPGLVQEDGTLDHAAKRAFPTPLSALGHFTGVGRRRASGTLAAYRAPQVEVGPVDAINGAFMLMRRKAIESVGLFDEGYWMYMEDLDLCYRLRLAGWITWYEPSVRVTHVKGGSSGTHRSLRLNFAFHYGMQRFYRAHYGPDRNPLANAAIVAAIWLKFCGSAIRSGVARAAASIGRRS